MGNLLSKCPKRSFTCVIKHEKDREKQRYMRKAYFDKFVKGNIRSDMNLSTLCRELSGDTAIKYLQDMELFDSSVLEECHTQIPGFNSHLMVLLNSAACYLTGHFIDILTRRIICEITAKRFDDHRITEFYDSRFSNNNEDGNESDSVTSKGVTYKLPLDFIYCYNKVFDMRYKSQDIITEIGVVSIANIVLWDGIFIPERYDLFYHLLKTSAPRIIEGVILPLVNYFSRIIKRDSTILCNPSLGSEFPRPDLFEDMRNVRTSIKADGDLIIDDTLYEIKCCQLYSKGYFFLQMLLYSCSYSCNIREDICPVMARSRARPGKKIRSMIVLDTYRGRTSKYNIESISLNQMLYILKLVWPGPTVEPAPQTVPESSSSSEPSGPSKHHDQKPSARPTQPKTRVSPFDSYVREAMRRGQIPRLTEEGIQELVRQLDQESEELNSRDDEVFPLEEEFSEEEAREMRKTCSPFVITGISRTITKTHRIDSKELIRD